MKPKYKYTKKEASKISKFGIDLVIYGQKVPEANVVHVHVEEGHFQEFYNKKSTFTYYIVQGEGVFILNDQRVKAKATDLIVIPPKTRIHYFGNMDMVLTTSPAFKEENEVEVRIVDKSESPYR